MQDEYVDEDVFLESQEIAVQVDPLTLGWLNCGHETKKGLISGRSFEKLPQIITLRVLAASTSADIFGIKRKEPCNRFSRYFENQFGTHID
jgi:hypothetical protein